MFCLSRHVDEAIMIGNELLVRVEQVQPQRVRLSTTRLTTLDAPSEAWLVRDEEMQLRSDEMQLGPDVTVSVVDIRDGKVRVGVIAPKDVPVHRKEVYEAIRRENQAAAQVQPQDVKDVVKDVVPRPQP